MANGAFNFKNNSGNIVSFISGSGSDIIISGGTLDLSGMSGLTLGNLTMEGTVETASFAPSYLLTSSFNTYSGTTNTVIGTLQTSTGSLNSFTSSASGRLNSIEGVTGSYATTGSNTFNGNLTVTGYIDAQELRTTYISSSILYRSGSTKFGDELSDTHAFTGSMLLSGSLTTTGNVGVGTTSPLSKFHVNTGTNQNFRVRPGTDVGATNGVALNSRTDDDGSLQQLTLRASDVIMLPSGNVGIGTATPSYPLEVFINSSTTYTTSSRGNVFRVYNSNTSANVFAGIELGGAGTANDGLAGINGVVTGSGNGALTFYTRNSNTFLEKMRINSDGNVGIGTTSPASRLNVAGAKTNSADLSNAANQLVVTDTTATAAGVGGRISFFGSYTSTPDYITFGAIEVLKDNANNYGSASWNNAAMRFIVGNNDNDANAGRLLERMRITSGGNVGIGTTSPSTQFNVGHESHGIGIAYMGGSALPSIGGLFTDTSSGQQGYGSLLVKSRSDYAGYSINFFTAASPNTPLERMRITSGGNVLIGTTTDGGYRFQVNGNSRFTNNGAGVASVSTSNSNTSDDAAMSNLNFDGNRLRLGVLASDSAYGCIGTNGGSTGLAFVTHNGTSWGERMRINSTGYLITNTTSDLNGGLIAQGVEYSIKIVGSLTGYVQGGLAISSGTDSTPSARGQGIFYFNEGNDVTWYNGSLYNSSDRFDICRKSSTSALDSSVAQTTHSLFNLNSSGAAYNATGTWGTISSDQRLKENIVDTTSKLNDVLSLRVRNFNYIGKDEKYIGFIAQELEEVFPSLVTTNDMREFDRDGNVISGLEDTKGVKVGMDFAILVKAIQEQQTIIEDLKSRLETLENN